MRRQTLPNRGLGILLAVACGAAHAQFPTGPSDDGEAGEPRRYAVEMIIFEYAEDVGLGTEVFVPDVIEPDPGVIDDFDNATAVEEASAASEVTAPVDVDIAVRRLARSELTMDETLARLERLDAYRPLMYFGWTQATIAEGQSPELPLARFGAPPSGLDGTLKLYLNRFLHLVVDVSKLAPDGGAARRPTRPTIDMSADRFDDPGDERRLHREVMTTEYEPLRYRIREDRIMKNGETRYYDHPKIGVIAKVTRIEDGEQEDASAGF